MLLKYHRLVLCQSLVRILFFNHLEFFNGSKCHLLSSRVIIDQIWFDCLKSIKYSVLPTSSQLHFNSLPQVLHFFFGIYSFSVKLAEIMRYFGLSWTGICQILALIFLRCHQKPKKQTRLVVLMGSKLRS